MSIFLSNMEDLRTKFVRYESSVIEESDLLTAKKEIGESDEIRTECLQQLRKELQNLKDIDPCLEEAFLLRFLRVSKYSVPKALQRIQKGYNQQEKILNAFKKCTLTLRKAKKLNHLLVSPYRMKNNSFLFIGLAGIVDHSKYSYMERFYSELLALNKLVDNPINQIYGATLLIDYTGFNIHSILATTPGNALLFVETLLSMFPIRNKECHIVNAPSIFTSFFKIFYPLLPKKIQNRIFVHPNNDNWKSLHAHIPAEILPEEYGGELRHESLLRALENFEELDEQFLEKFAYGHKNTQHRRKNLRVITVEDKK